MSTRSTIGVIQPNGSVIGVYCHFDGYLDGVGKTLNKYYRDPAKVKELMTLGRNGISVLGKEIGEKQDFNKPADRKLSWCLFYGRDRGDKKRITYTYNNVSDFKDGFDEDYGYLYDPKSNTWFAFESHRLVYIPGQSIQLINAMWKKITGATNESTQFKFAEIAKKILKENKNSLGMKNKIPGISPDLNKKANELLRYDAFLASRSSGQSKDVIPAGQAAEKYFKKVGLIDKNDQIVSPDKLEDPELKILAKWFHDNIG